MVERLSTAAAVVRKMIERGSKGHTKLMAEWMVFSTFNEPIDFEGFMYDRGYIFKLENYACQKEKLL